jgi:VanZ family protein
MAAEHQERSVQMRKKYSDNLRNKQRFLTVLKILLPLLYALLLLFIFGNSLQTGEESAETSSRVVDAVQAVVAWVAPQSPIATATGEAYAKLHADIRTLAHFSEFALLGALACGCCLVYGLENKATKGTNNGAIKPKTALLKKYLPIGFGSLLFVPLLDETLQSFTANRAAEWLDLAVDFSGGIVGYALVLGCFLAVSRYKLYKKPRR